MGPRAGSSSAWSAEGIIAGGCVTSAVSVEAPEKE